MHSGVKMILVVASLILLWPGGILSLQAQTKRGKVTPAPRKPAVKAEGRAEREEQEEQEERRERAERERREKAERAALVKKAKSRDEAELLELQNERWEAYEEKDVRALRRILADDYTVTFEDGLVFDKEHVLDMVAYRGEGEIEYRALEPKVRIFGTTAIITGKFQIEYEAGDLPTLRETRFTDTYVMRNRRWYLVASHFSFSFLSKPVSGK